MKRILLLVSAAIFAVGTAFAQDTLKVEMQLSDSELAHRSYNEGVSLYESKNFDQAVQKFHESLAKDSSLVEAYLLIGVSQREMKQFPAAIASIEQYLAIEQQKAADTAYFILAQIYRETNDEAAELTAINHCLEHNANYKEALYLRGVKRFEEADFEGALADFSGAVSNGDQSPETFNDRGSTYRQLNRYDEALADYTKAIEQDPKAIYYCNRASVYAKKELMDEAVGDYTKAIVADAKYYKAYNGRGVAKANMEDFAGAVSDFSECLRLQPDYVSALSNRGIAYYKMKKYAEAVADLDAVIKAEPQNGSTYMYRGNVKEMLRDKAGACADWKKAADLGVAAAKRYVAENCK